MSERPEEALEWLWAHRKDADAANDKPFSNRAEEILDYIEDLNIKINEARADSKRLDTLDVMKIASLETVFYAIQRDFPVPVREAIDRVDLGEGEQ